MQNAIVTAVRPPPVCATAPAEIAPNKSTLPNRRRTFAKGEPLFAEGESAEYFYKVLSGTILTSMSLRDGRRQIDAFHIPGAVLGLENSNVRSCTAEAIEPVTAEVFRHSEFATLLDEDPSLGKQLMSSMTASFNRAFLRRWLAAA